MQQLIAAAIVLCAFWVVAKRYAPKALRKFAQKTTVRLARRLKWIWLAERLEKQAQDDGSCGSGCGSCGSCGDDGVDKAEEKIVAMPVSLKGNEKIS